MEIISYIFFLPGTVLLRCGIRLGGNGHDLRTVHHVAYYHMASRVLLEEIRTSGVSKNGQAGPGSTEGRLGDVVCPEAPGRISLDKPRGGTGQHHTSAISSGLDHPRQEGVECPRRAEGDRKRARRGKSQFVK